MFTHEKIAEVLQSHTEDGISQVRTRQDHKVLSRLDNWIDTNQPYHFVIDPITEKQGLRILVYSFLRLPECSDTFRKLLLINTGLQSGCLCTKPPDKGLLFKAEHLYEVTDGAPSTEFFDDLLGRCVGDVRTIEQILLFESMIGAGAAKESAEQFVQTIFGDDEESIITTWNDVVMESQNNQ